MIQDLRHSKTFETELSLNTPLQTLKAKIKKQLIPSNSFIKIKSDDFTFIYQYFPVNYQKNNTRLSKIRSPTSITQLTHDQDVLLKGCKSFLKYYNITMVEIENITPQLQFLFCQLILKDQTGHGTYLASQEDQLLKSDVLGQRGRIWLCEKQSNGRVRFSNYHEKSYLGIDSDAESLKVFRVPTAHTLFRLQRNDETDDYTLTSISARSSQDIQKPQIISKGTFKIKIVEVKQFVIKLEAQKMYLEWNLQRQKSMKVLADGLKEMLFYDNSQFANQNEIVVKQVQQYFFQNKLTHRIAELLYNNVENIEVSPDFHFVPVRNNCFRQCSYLCQNNKNNSKLFYRVLTSMFINLYQYGDDIILLLSQNHLFRKQFYRQGWFKLMIEKIYTGKQKQLEKIMPKIYQICAIMCSNLTRISKNTTPHIPNQYLLHHTIAENLPNSHFGLDITVHGQYVFLIHDKESTEIKTYLQKGQKKQEDQFRQNIFKSWIRLITAICCGCNVNCMNQYRDVIKALVPYCYMEKFPVLENTSIKKVILQAFAAVQQRQSCQQLFTNRYTVGIIDTFISQTQSKTYFIFSTKQLNKKYQNTLSIRYLRQLYLFFLDFCSKEYQQIKSNNKIIQQYLKPYDGLKSWLKIVQICLGARLIEIKQKKSSQILRYVKKIFEKVEVQLRKQKQKAQEKSLKNFILLILEILQFSPQYQKYLLSIDYIPKRNFNYDFDVNNQLNQLNQLFKISNPNKIKAIYLESYYYITKFQNSWFNRSLTINEIITNFYPHNQNSEELLDIKLHICNILILILQKINEEQVEEAVKTLEYWIKQPTHLTRYDLVQFKPSYTFQEAIKMIIIEQWYLISHPIVFNRLTTCLRYLYRKNEIYRQMVKDLAVIDHSLSMKFYQMLSSNTQMLRKTIAGVKTWFRQAILVKYQQQLDFLQSNFKQIAVLLQKISDMITEQNQNLKEGESPKITQHFLQKILEQCSLINIIIKYCTAVNQLDERTHALKFDILDKIDQYILAILNFYIKNNRRNSIVVINFLGEYLTKLPQGISCLITLLETYHEMIQCLSENSWLNLFKNLPTSLKFFEILSKLPTNIFMKGVEKIDYIFIQIWTNTGRLYQQLGNQMKSIIKNHEIRMILLKIGCRILHYLYQNEINYGFFFRTGKYLSWIWRFLKQSLHLETRLVQNNKSSEIKQNVYEKRILINIIHYYLIAEHQDFCLEDSKIPILVQKQLYKQESVEFSQGDINSIIVQYLRKQLIIKNIEQSYEPSVAQLEYYVLDLLPVIQYQMYLFDQYSVIECVKAMIKQLKSKKLGKLNSVQISRLDLTEQLLKLVEKKKFVEIEKVGIKPRPLQDYQLLQNKIYTQNIQQKSTLSAPIKKWQKAKRKFLALPSCNPSLIEDFAIINTIYQQNKPQKKFFETSKNKIDQNNKYFPIMPKDLFNKLYVTINHFNILQITQENRMFLLEEFLFYWEKVLILAEEQEHSIYHSQLGEKILEMLFQGNSLDINTVEMSLYIKIIVVSSKNLEYLNIDFLTSLLHRVSLAYNNDLITLYLQQKTKEEHCPLLLLLNFIDKIQFPPADSQTLGTLYQQLLKIKILFGIDEIIRNLCESILSKLKILMYRESSKKQKQESSPTEIQLMKQIFSNPYNQLLYISMQTHQYDL